MNLSGLCWEPWASIVGQPEFLIGFQMRVKYLDVLDGSAAFMSLCLQVAMQVRGHIDLLGQQNLRQAHSTSMLGPAVRHQIHPTCIQGTSMPTMVWRAFQLLCTMPHSGRGRSHAMLIPSCRTWVLQHCLAGHITLA